MTLWQVHKMQQSVAIGDTFKRFRQSIVELVFLRGDDLLDIRSMRFATHFAVR